jgi:hypothetical protein
MNHELHAAGFIEEALEHDRVLGGQAAKRGVRGSEVSSELCGGFVADADFVGEIRNGRIAARRPLTPTLSRRERERNRCAIPNSRCLS